MKSSEIVMNIEDLRKLIFSYFRKKPEIICITCKKTCVWNKKIIRQYTEYPIKDCTVTIRQCCDCFFKFQTMEFFL